MLTPIIAQCLANSKTFRAASKDALHNLAQEVEFLKVPARNSLISQGEVGDSMYIVVSGRLLVLYPNTKASNEKEFSRGEVGVGESFGEMSVLTEHKSLETVRTLKDTELIKISKSSFDRMVKKYPATAMEIVRIIASSFTQETRQLVSNKTISAIAVFPASRYLALPEFCSRLKDALSAHGSTSIMNSQKWNELYGDKASQIESEEHREKIKQMGSWLSELETKYKYTIYEAEYDWSLWSRLCARQANRYLLLGLGNTDPQKSEMVDTLFFEEKRETAPIKKLVLLHKNGNKKPVMTQKWLDKIPEVNGCHHIRFDLKSDFDKLARFLTGKAVCLVLGGGGARGFAHIGVLKAMREAQIPIDYIGGTSMGSMISAFHAMGWDEETIIKNTKEHFIASNPLTKSIFHFTFFFFGSKKIQKILKNICGNLHIEDLWKRYFCISTNITSAKTMVHLRGRLWKRLIASSSLPGILDPVIHKSELLVDGGVLNNLPGDVMRNLCDGVVIGVDVGADRDLKVIGEQGDISHYGTVMGTLFPFKRRKIYPNFGEIFMRTITLNSVVKSNEVESSMDYYLRPPIQDFGLLEFTSIEKIAEIGYQSAIPFIEEFKSKFEV